MTTTTKTIREIQYLGPDGQLLEYVPNMAASGHPTLTSGAHPSPAPRGIGHVQNYEQIGGGPEYDPNVYQVSCHYPRSPNLAD